MGRYLHVWPTITLSQCVNIYTRGK